MSDISYSRAELCVLMDKRGSRAVERCRPLPFRPMRHLDNHGDLLAGSAIKAQAVFEAGDLSLQISQPIFGRDHDGLAMPGLRSD